MRAVEIFQTIGAIVGFVAGAITLYDRLLRYRPYVSIYAELDGANAWPLLRVSNAAPYDIFVSEIIIEPPLIALSQQQTVRAMVEAIIRAKITAAIKVRESAAFHIIEAPRSADAARRTKNRIKIKVRWHRLLPSIIQPLASTIDTSLDDIQQRKEAAVRSGHSSD
jgi:hypothetical protein